MTNAFLQALKIVLITFGAVAALYLAFLGLLTTKWLQTHAIYLHAFQMTWFKDLDTPEAFGFLHNQVTPFRIQSGDDTSLYAWHILPIGLYSQSEDQLLAEKPGPGASFETRLAFKLLRDDPESYLVIHLHGAGGTVGSGYRTPNYRALSAGQNQKVHVLTFDYRGFGRSPGVPSESGVISDAITVVDWALNVAGIPPSRIIVFGQSLGTAVNIAVAQHYIHQEPPILFAGHILIAPFVDVPSLVSTYSIMGVVPLLSPLRWFPPVFDFFEGFIRDRWPTKQRVADYVMVAESLKRKYRITIVHAEDDWDIPWQHTVELFYHSINATKPDGMASTAFEKMKSERRRDLDRAGSIVEWHTDHGTIREEILKYGLHDVIMGNSVITLAVIRMLLDS